MHKRWFRLTCSIVAAIVAFIILIGAVLHTPPAQRFVFDQLRSYLRRTAGMEVETSAFNLNYLQGAATLEGLVVRSTRTPDFPPLFSAARVYANIGILDAVRGSWIIEQLTLTKPEIHYFMASDGRTNLPKTRPSSGPAPEILFLHAEALQGSFRYQNLRSKIDARMPRWHVTLAGNPQSRAHRIAFRNQQPAAVHYGSAEIPIQVLELSGDLHSDSLQLHTLRIEAAGSALSAKGLIRNFSKPTLDLSLDARLALRSLASAAGAQAPVGGSISGALHIAGTPDRIQLQTALTGSDISALSYRQTRFTLMARGEWQQGPEGLFLKKFALSSPEGRVEGTARLYPAGSSRLNTVAVHIQNLDLFPLWKLIHPPFDLASRAGGNAAMQWQGALDPQKITVTARLNLTAARSLPGHSLLPVSGRVDARLQAHRLQATVQALNAFGMETDGQLSMRNFQAMEGSFQGNSTNIDHVIRQLARFLGETDPSPLGTTVSGPLQFRLQAGGSLKHPQLTATMDTPSLEIGKLKHLGAQTRAIFDNSTLRFQSTLALPHSASIAAEGSLDFGGRATRLSLNAAASAVPVAAIPAMLDRKIPASGTMQASLNLQGPLDNLAGNASLTGEGLEFHGEFLGRLDAQLLLSDKQIRSTQFQLHRNPLDSSRDKLEARLLYDLDSKQFQLQADATALSLKRRDAAAYQAGAHRDGGHRDGGHHNGGPFDGTVDLTISGTGTMEQPSLQMRLASDNIRVHQRSTGPVTVAASLIHEDVRIDATAPQLKLSASVRGSNRAPYPFEGEITASDSDLSILGLKLGGKHPVSGLLNAVIRGSGNADNPEDSVLTARIRDFKLRAANLEIHTQEPAIIEYRNQAIEIFPTATLATGSSSVMASGRIPMLAQAPDGKLDLKARVDMAEILPFLPAREGLAAKGIIHLDLALTGSRQNLGGTGTIALDNGEIKIPQSPLPLTAITLRADLQDGGLTLSKAEAAWGPGTIALTGEFPFGLLPANLPVTLPRRKGPARFVLDMKNLSPEIAGIFPKEIAGSVSVRATGQADRMDLRALTAQIIFRDLNFSVDTVRFQQKDSSQIDIRDGIASISKFSIIGPQTNLAASGSIGLDAQGPLQLSLAGDLDAALLTFASNSIKTAGTLQLQIQASGVRSAPALTGYAEMHNGRLSIRNPRIVADGLQVRLNLTPDQISIQKFNGTLNGGPLTIEGSIGYRKGLYNGIDLKASLQDFYLNFPEGLKSSSSGNLTVTSAEDSIIIGGNLRIQESAYRESIEVGGQVMNYLKSQQVIKVGEEPNPLLDRIRFNISARTVTPLLVQNNIARVEASASNLRLVGSIDEPSLVGRITLNEGGEILLNQRTYYINRGVITLVNQNRIEPELNIQAQTKVGSYDITLQMAGNPERLTTVLSSEPPLAERDILSLLLTGRTASETQGREMQMVRTQALSLIAGQAGEEVTGEARKALHLSTLRIDPGQIASESDPGARLTIGEDITRKLSLIYSMNLMNGGDQIWAAQYDIGRRLATQATKQQDNTYRFEFRHDLRFGAASPARAASAGRADGARRATRTAASRFHIGAIQLRGGGPFSEKNLLDTLKTKPGDKYDFSKLQKGLDRLQDLYARNKHLEADIRIQRETQEQTVDLKLDIQPGPVVDFSFEGFTVAQRTRDNVRTVWADGAFETERLDDAVLEIRRAMIRDGYLESEVAVAVETAGEQKQVHFRITPGAHYANVVLSFPGASAIPSGTLNNLLDQAGLKLDIHTDPQKVLQYLKRYYQERGYLQAQPELPQRRLDAATGTGAIAIPIKEGPLFTIGELQFSGNHAFSYDEIWMVIPTSSGSSYDPNTLRNASKAIENLYHSKGYNDISVTFRVVQNSAKAQADLTFQITERRQSFIRDIVIEGNRGASESFIAKQLDFKNGDALDFEKINETRKRLYATGVFASVDFQTEEMTMSDAAAAHKNMRVRIRLRENRPYRLQYGLFYDTERGLGGLLEAQNMNVLGRASNLGLRLRYDTDLKEARLYYNQPFVRLLHLKLDASAFVQQEERSSYSAKRLGFSLIQERSLPREYRLDYGYRYDHVRWKPEDVALDPTIFQADVPVARLLATLTRDTRDGVLDPTRGEFTSHTFEFGPRWLGSEVGFARYSGQYFRYVSLDKYLGRPIKDKEGRGLPRKFIYAGAVRLGLTSAFGGSHLSSPERFFSGGGTTMRGFEQDLLGPVTLREDGSLRPKGGEGLFLFNNEFRFPIAGMLHGVGFLDIGNVYEKLSDFNFSLRKTAGAGLRLKIKFIPLRFDYGFKLDRRPGESAGEFFFSIGQAF